MAPYLDRHLVFPLLEFLEKYEIYPVQELLEQKLELVAKSDMVDFTLDIAAKIGGVSKERDEALKVQREQIVERMKRLKEECQPLLAIVEDVEKVKALRENKQFTLGFLSENFNVTQKNVISLYDFGKFWFECGNYAKAADFLSHCRLLFTSMNLDRERSISAIWGKLASEILMQQWETALDDMNRLREIIDSRSFTTPLQQLQQRTWLIHWSLFVFFNHHNGRNGIIDMFFAERYLNTIQTNCPHILRYLTTAVITNKRRRNVLKDLVKIIQQESYTYKDPITEFLEMLYVHFDFEGAQKKLLECETVLKNDFFLVACHEEFIENARLFIFETYCRIHQCIDISMLATKLNMDKDSAERWIVNLIRNARLDAKIDSVKSHVLMGSANPSVYQQVIEKTKGLSFRSYVLASNLDRRRAPISDA
jgi:translation initiation factor 3 subunit E